MEIKREGEVQKDWGVGKKEMRGRGGEDEKGKGEMVPWVGG